MPANQIRRAGQRAKSRDPWLASARSFLGGEHARTGGRITFDDGTHAIAGSEPLKAERLGLKAGA